MTKDADVKQPATARGVRSRAALVAAARVVFERDGYLDSRLTDITAEAGVAVGTFYTYFSSKEQVFTAVLEDAQDDMLHPGLPHVADADADPLTVLAASNRAYLTAFRRNGRLMVLMNQVAWVHPDLMAHRRRRAERFAVRNSRWIAALQARGLADPDLDPDVAAFALSAMTSRVALEGLVQGDLGFDVVLATVNRLWANGLQLRRSTESQAGPTAEQQP